VSIWSREFWKTSLELALRGAAAGFITSTGGSAFDVWHMQWKTIGGFTLSGALVSVAFSLIGKQRGDKDSPLMTAPHGWNPVDPLEDG
jgi:hypothetical protein